MKNLIYLVALIFVFASCSKQNPSDIITDQLQTNDAIETTVSLNAFNDLMEERGLQPATSESVGRDNLSEVDSRTDVCDTCDPWLSSISTYNLGGNNRGFGVSGGRNHPCTYELFWFSTNPNVTVNWTAGGFAHMTFPGSGTYQVWVNLKSKVPNTSSSCIVSQFTTVTIP